MPPAKPRIPQPKGAKDSVVKAGHGNSKYSVRILEVVSDLIKLGLSIEEMANYIGVQQCTFDEWRKKVPELDEIVQRGRTGPDAEVAASLYRRATGYTRTVEKIFYDAKSGEIVRCLTDEHIPPDTVACIFWLKNRRPDLWRQKADFDVDAAAKQGIEFVIVKPQRVAPAANDASAA